MNKNDNSVPWGTKQGLLTRLYIYFINLLVGLGDTDLILLYQMAILYSPVQIHQQYFAVPSYTQEWSTPKLKYLQNQSDYNFSICFPQVDSKCKTSCKTSHTFSCSGGVAQLIIMGWSGSKFQKGNLSIKLQKWWSEVWSQYFGEY